jgi:uncharacterized protein (UPF0332 family)
MVLAEWRRARLALRAAELLTREDCYADAVSRAYYAILHAAKAALYVHNATAESHTAAKRMFGLHLIRTGELEPEWSAHLGESQDDRLAADYDAEASFSKEKARHECRRTRQFLSRIRQYLLTKGFTAYEPRR